MKTSWFAIALFAGLFALQHSDLESPGRSLLEQAKQITKTATWSLPEYGWLGKDKLIVWQGQPPRRYAVEWNTRTGKSRPLAKFNRRFAQIDLRENYIYWMRVSPD